MIEVFHVLPFPEPLILAVILVPAGTLVPVKTCPTDMVPSVKVPIVKIPVVTAMLEPVEVKVLTAVMVVGVETPEP
jgi:hypothetical protein